MSDCEPNAQDLAEDLYGIMRASVEHHGAAGAALARAGRGRQAGQHRCRG
jgi:hypothetical protein